MMVTIDLLLEQFSIFGVDVNDTVLVKCLEVCLLNGINEEALVEQWMAYSLSNLGGVHPTVDTLAQMERKIFKDSGSAAKPLTKTPAKETKCATLTIYDSSSTTNNDDAILHEDILDSYTTPKPKKNIVSRVEQTPRGNGSGQTVEQCVGSRVTFSPASFSPVATTPSSKYTGRAHSGMVQCQFGQKNPLHSKKTSFRPTIKYTNSEEKLEPNTPYMHEETRDTALTMRHNTQYLGSQILKKYSLDATVEPCSLDDTGGDPSESKPLDAIVMYGRLRSDGEGRMSANSLVLETLQLIGDLAYVPLNIGGMDNFALFPGQVVAIEGTKPAGDKIVVNNIYSNIAAPLPTTTPSLSRETGLLEVIVTAGPYTPTDTMAYEPIEDLIGYVARHKPHLVFLIGPFIDAMQMQISMGMLAETYDSFFEKMMDRIAIRIKGLDTQIVVIPSWRDAHHHNVYPTAPFSMKKQYPNIHFMADPSVLDIEGIIIGCTSVDVLLHLGKEDFSRISNLSRIMKLASHVINQQCFYPLYPPAEELSVDFGLWSKHALLEVTPHILILPSDANFFIKEIDGCVVINPGRLTKGLVGGTFARLEISPHEDTFSPKNIYGEVIKI